MSVDPLADGGSAASVAGTVGVVEAGGGEGAVLGSSPPIPMLFVIEDIIDVRKVRVAIRTSPTIAVPTTR
ncbi:hypothetical protein [Tsukamurella tyrosinosolvens]|uniref:hypothetical protein n=1 Tax=Tsukamurella tyrosinosolvens TaxID=57704 RepID=UPI0011E4D9B0|nr:hypothetical protein [Tsukamurella tyrosinosolvens]